MFFKKTAIVSWIQKTGSIKYRADGVSGQKIPDEDGRFIIFFVAGTGVEKAPGRFTDCA